MKFGHFSVSVLLLSNLALTDTSAFHCRLGSQRDSTPPSMWLRRLIKSTAFRNIPLVLESARSRGQRVSNSLCNINQSLRWFLSPGYLVGQDFYSFFKDRGEFLRRRASMDAVQGWCHPEWMFAYRSLSHNECYQAAATRQVSPVGFIGGLAEWPQVEEAILYPRQG